MTPLKLTLTAAILASAGSMASAANYFATTASIDAFDTVMTLDLVRSEAPGMVVIENQQGEVVGMIDVHAGANSNLRIQLDSGVRQDLTAKLVLADGVAATKTIDVDRF